MLYKLCKEDKIRRVMKDQYIFPDSMGDELLSISKRSEQIVISHETAFFLYGISGRTPFEHTITIPTGYIPSAGIKAQCKVYYIKPEPFEWGKTEMKSPAEIWCLATTWSAPSVIASVAETRLALRPS